MEINTFWSIVILDEYESLASHINASYLISYAKKNRMGSSCIDSSNSKTTITPFIGFFRKTGRLILN
jgi:hypothetical protein